VAQGSLVLDMIAFDFNQRTTLLNLFLQSDDTGGDSTGNKVVQSPSDFSLTESSEGSREEGKYNRTIAGGGR
jgi:hypothetical protein